MAPVNPRDPDLAALVAIFERLRGPDGCAWDRSKSLEDLAPHLREECDEVVAAIASGDRENLREELGDLLANLVFTVQVAREEGAFTMADVVEAARDKLVRRHPHVFGDAKADTPEEVEAQWQRIKAEEKREKGEIR